MIEPTKFGFNDIASESNSFQNRPEEENAVIQKKALSEFQGAVKKLRDASVQVSVFKDELNSTTPDSIFPNNWISTHRSGHMILYPMAISNRRAERKASIIASLNENRDYSVSDLSSFENGENPIFLEGTGSLIFDHQNKVVYAAISPRTNESLVNQVASILGYESICFKSYGKSGELIYHTNVMMCVGEDFIIIGDRTIDDEDRNQVIRKIIDSGKHVITLSNDQVYNHFAGNMLQIKNTKGEKLLVMSQTAYDSLSPDQKSRLEQHNDQLITLEISTIEYVGGGSARCMLAEIFPVDQSIRSPKTQTSSI